jgi:hypothetical protein
MWTYELEFDPGGARRLHVIDSARPIGGWEVD